MQHIYHVAYKGYLMMHFAAGTVLLHGSSATVETGDVHCPGDGRMGGATAPSWMEPCCGAAAWGWSSFRCPQGPVSDRSQVPAVS